MKLAVALVHDAPPERLPTARRHLLEIQPIGWNDVAAPYGSYRSLKDQSPKSRWDSETSHTIIRLFAASAPPRCHARFTPKAGTRHCGQHARFGQTLDSYAATNRKTRLAAVSPKFYLRANSASALKKRPMNCLVPIRSKNAYFHVWNSPTDTVFKRKQSEIKGRCCNARYFEKGIRAHVAPRVYRHRFLSNKS